MRLDERPPCRCAGAVRIRRIREALFRFGRPIWDRTPLTGFGAGVLAASLALGLGFAAPRRDYVLQVVAAAAGLLVLVSMGAVGFAAWRCARLLDRDPEPPADADLEAERGFVWGRVIPSPLAAVGLRTRVAAISPPLASESEADARGQIRERLRATHRGWLDRVHREIGVEDAFGLARVRLRRTDPDHLRVRPWLGALERVPEVQAFRSGDLWSHPEGRAVGDRVDLRPYQVGDPLRWAAWKIYARTGELLVRVPERAREPEHRWAAFLVGSSWDEASAAWAYLAVQRGLLGEHWSFGADGWAEPTREREQALNRILNVSHGAAGDLSAFLDAEESGAGLRLVVFGPPVSGPWLDRVAEARARCGAVTLLIAHDGIRPPVSRTYRWMRAPAPIEAGRVHPAPSQVAQVVQRAESSGVSVFVLNRREGRAEVAPAGERFAA